jgi:uncharacterized protein (DUF302 family)
MAQTNETILTNADVIEMVKAGLSEGIINAKIKQSKTTFDTTPNGLASLKAAGVPETVVISMISGAKSEKVALPLILDDTPIDIRNAFFKKTIFVDCSDDKARQEILQLLDRAGFKVVSEISAAELLLKLTSTKVSRTMGTGGLLTMTNTVDVEMGKLSIYVLEDKKGRLVFMKEKKNTFPAKYLFTQAKNYTEDFIEELIKAQKKKS